MSRGTKRGMATLRRLLGGIPPTPGDVPRKARRTGPATPGEFDEYRHPLVFQLFLKLRNSPSTDEHNWVFFYNAISRMGIDNYERKLGEIADMNARRAEAKARARGRRS